MATLLTVSVSKAETRTQIREDDGREREWTSGIFKRPVEGAVWVGKINLAGDEQADLKNHGGEHQPVMAYSAEHYDLWRAELPDTPWVHGGFGENFTISGHDEKTVCIGDVYAVGGVRLEVSAPRFPCWKLSRRWDMIDLSARVDENYRSGWYLRVLEEGDVQAGMTVERLARPYPTLTIYAVHQILDDLDTFRAEALELSDCPALKPGLAAHIRRKLGG